jgi:5-methylcytosine-specific restriction endonuclease McrA
MSPCRDPGLRRCSQCHRERAIGQFERNGKRGRRTACKECRREAWVANGARRRKAGAGYVLRGTIRSLWTAQAGLCKSCGRALGDYHVDHVIPLAKGGRHEASNLALLCPTCNLRKGAR